MVFITQVSSTGLNGARQALITIYVTQFSMKLHL